MVLVRFLDLVVLAMAAPFVVLLDVPLLGFAVGAVAWTVQRFLAIALERRAKAQENIKATLGLNLAGMFGRAWLVALSIVVVGTVGAREDGLTAAVLTLVAFTLYFATTLLSRGMASPSAPSTTPTTTTT